MLKSTKADSQTSLFSEQKQYKISRSKIDLFLECPRCFYLDVKMRIKRPSGPPFLLNSAVDYLLKQEFDVYRAKGTQHPLLTKYGIDATPVAHKDLNKWRHNFTGIQYHHAPTDILVFGAIDDLWQNSKGEYIVVDYKATSKNTAAKTAKDLWPGFLTQMEIYQWLLRKNGFVVSKTGYFVNCNATKDRVAFDAKLEFNISLIPYVGDDTWLEQTLKNIRRVLNSQQSPEHGSKCSFCAYVDSVSEA